MQPICLKINEGGGTFLIKSCIMVYLNLLPKPHTEEKSLDFFFLGRNQNGGLTFSRLDPFVHSYKQPDFLNSLSNQRGGEYKRKLAWLDWF